MQLVIELPPREQQIAFNRRRWEEVCADPELARLSATIETNAYGHILMIPTASGAHSHRQFKVQVELSKRIGGLVLPECPISTMDGVRAADVGWFSDDRFWTVQGQTAFETAPEICVEILSPGNTSWEMRAKKRLYFEAGAEEVWLCAADGTMSMFCHTDPDQPLPNSIRCPGFPVHI